MVKIRVFRRGDEEVYARVHNEGYSTEEWFNALEKPVKIEDVLKLDYDATFFAELNDTVVGLVDIKIRNDLADIENLVVLADYRRKGVGQALLERAVEFSLRRNLKQIRVEVPAEDEVAVKFYTERGFRHVTYAYLIEINDESFSRQGLGPYIFRIENHKYWVSREEGLEPIRSGARFSIVGRFMVMTRVVKDVQA